MASLVARGDCVDYVYFPRGARRSRSRGVRAPALAGGARIPSTSLFSLSELPLVLVSGRCVRPAGAFARAAAAYTLRF